MSRGKTMKTLLGLICVLASTAATSVSAAQADFGVAAFDGQVTANAQGDAYTQAGGHPYSAWSAIDFNTHLDPEYGIFKLPDGDPRDIHVDLPPGFVGNPTVASRCTLTEFFGGEGNTACMSSAQVGVANVKTSLGLPNNPRPIYALVPEPGTVASFGFMFSGVPVFLTGRLRPTDYGISIDSEGINQGLQLTGTSVELWGTPADASHDQQRCANIDPSSNLCEGPQGDPVTGPNKAEIPPLPFLTNPTRCTPAGTGLRTDLRMDSWQAPNEEVEAHFISHLPPAYPAPPDQWGPPQGTDHCEGLPFAPSLTARPSDASAEASSGLSVSLRFPQDGLESSGGFATAHLRRAAVTLPEGMTINPAAASGLGACTDPQLGLHTNDPLGCPDSSKIGTVTATTPLLEEPLSGSVYIRSQNSNDPASGEMFRLALVLENEERGIDVRLGGQVKANPTTGQIEAIFDENPQLPAGEISVDFKSGPRAVLAMPATCGRKTVSAVLTSWAGQVANVGDSFTIPCPNDQGFSPAFNAGTANPLAGSTSPFGLTINRESNQQSLSGLTVKLPKGLTAYLKGVAYCPDASIAAASGTSGNAELGSSSCPVASQIGSVRVGAGAGSNPFYVTGKAYLAGPYKGAPLSLAVITPATAGPFDLGTVVVRAALNIDPATAEITAVSDPLPQIVKGVPLRLRAIDLSVDRPDFNLNPTSCDPMAVSSTITSAQGATATPSSPFQVGSCERLNFAPRLTLSVKGGHKRGAYQRLKAVLTAKPGEANIAKVSVGLPHSEFLAQEHINTICTRVQFAADNCPSGSIYGHARAFTPLLDQPLEGPVYLRSSNNPLPDLVAALHGQIDIDLAGRIDSVNGGIRNTFNLVPDAPVTKFVLEMKGGKKSLLVNSRNICRSTSKATVKMDGQNGKVHDFKPVLGSSCGRPAKR